jgi:hypothetical protein
MKIAVLLFSAVRQPGSALSLTQARCMTSDSRLWAL